MNLADDNATTLQVPSPSSNSITSQYSPSSTPTPTSSSSASSIQLFSPSSWLNASNYADISSNNKSFSDDTAAGFLSATDHTNSNSNNATKIMSHLFGGSGSGDYLEQSSSSSSDLDQPEQLYFGHLCRMRRKINDTEDKYNVPQPFFNKFACFKCAGYLRLDTNMPYDPDPENETSILGICNELEYGELDCTRWKQCCQNAVDCCNSQIFSQQPNATSLDFGNSQCPQVWDGFSCVPRTKPGQMAYIPCPNFIYPSNDPGPFEAFGYRTCTSDGEWALHPEKQGDYTFYHPCADVIKDWDEFLNDFKIACECISIFTLATSIFCFVYCRQLRHQAPYRVHTQMFLAMLLYTISCLLRETIVFHFSTINNFPPGCETITMLVRLFMITSYSAMSVEAFYLHWNVACAFRQLTRLRILFAIGWSFPVIIIGIYVALRLVFGDAFYNDECWIKPWGDFEYIIYGPNFACLALNIIFLISLFFITCRLQTVQRRRGQPCELLKRREFRAMITFTFLFGVPQVLVLIRPTSLTGVWFKFYELSSVALLHLQGAFASVLLCYLNADVRNTFFRTALGLCIAREGTRYGSIASNLSTRVRNSVASFERRRSTFAARRSKVTSRASGDSVSAEMTPMMRTPTESTISRPASLTCNNIIIIPNSNNYNSNSNNSHHHHHHHRHHHRPSQSLSPVPGSETSSPVEVEESVTSCVCNDDETTKNRVNETGFLFRISSIAEASVQELAPLTTEVPNNNDNNYVDKDDSSEAAKGLTFIASSNNNNLKDDDATSPNNNNETITFQQQIPTNTDEPQPIND